MTDIHNTKEPFDLPPPYTPSAAEPSNSRNSYYHNQSTSPLPPLPTHNTINQQQSTTGHLSRDSTSSTVQSKNGKGPLESVVGTAGGMIGTAAGAIGGTCVVTGAIMSVMEAASRTASVAAATQAKRVKTYVQDEYVLWKSLSSEVSHHYQQDKKLSAIDKKNNSKLYTKQANSPLRINESWYGRECVLKNSNGNILVNGSIGANKFIHLETSHGDIAIEGCLQATKDIFMKASNGLITINGQSILSKSLTVESSNTPLRFENIIESKRSHFKTKGAPIVLRNVFVVSELTVRTTNAPVEIYVQDISSSSANISIETTNAPVNVYLPHQKFSGEFDLKSKNGKTSIVVAEQRLREGNHSYVSFCNNENSSKSGKYKNGNRKANQCISIKSTKGLVKLHIH